MTPQAKHNIIPVCFQQFFDTKIDFKVSSGLVNKRGAKYIFLMFFLNLFMGFNTNTSPCADICVSIPVSKTKLIQQ